jgi:hypothetical protein
MQRSGRSPATAVSRRLPIFWIVNLASPSALSSRPLFLVSPCFGFGTAAAAAVLLDRGAGSLRGAAAAFSFIFFAGAGFGFARGNTVSGVSPSWINTAVFRAMFAPRTSTS